ncbi:MAG: FAD-dependent oxidoreductase [Planctomycetaceae bacterium]|nr:FAD-dependent oxidoreductase [Planctomycetaceae bacterium]
MAKTAVKEHIVIIGGGVIGISTAYYLASRGCRVTVLEQNEIGSGASRGNAGQITPGHGPLNQPGTLRRNIAWLLRSSSPLHIPLRPDWGLFRWLLRFQQSCRPGQVHNATRVLCELGNASIALFDGLAEEFQFGYQAQGRLEVCHTVEGLRSAQQEASLLRLNGCETEDLTPQDVVDIEPTLNRDMAGAIYYPRSAYCDPHAFVLKLAEASRERGAKLRPHTQVSRLRRQVHRCKVDLTTGETIDADFLVLACGAWSPSLGKQLGIDLPIQSGKGYHVDMELSGQRPKTPAVLVEKRIFASPIGESLRLAGTMEFSGFNLRMKSKRLTMLSIGATDYLSGISDARVSSRWCHLRPMTSDGLPVIGPLPSDPRIWIAAGHGMLGLTQAPITGKLVAEGILDQNTSIDLKPLRLNRF